MWQHTRTVALDWQRNQRFQLQHVSTTHRTGTRQSLVVQEQAAHQTFIAQCSLRRIPVKPEQLFLMPISVKQSLAVAPSFSSDAHCAVLESPDARPQSATASLAKYQGRHSKRHPHSRPQSTTASLAKLSRKTSKATSSEKMISLPAAAAAADLLCVTLGFNLASKKRAYTHRQVQKWV